jgi:uncharacterized protein
MKIARPLYTAQTTAALASNAAVVLLGPRQVGKTTLAQHFVNEATNVQYLDLERESDLRKLDDAGGFLRRNRGSLTIIDEVHRVPTLFAELRSIIDEGRREGFRTGQFLLLGSASLDLVQQSAETLAGRVAYIELPPILPPEAIASGIDIETLWLRGGFPESLLAFDDRDSLQWRKNFTRSYLERDVPMFAPRVPSAMVGRLWTMLAHGQGTLLNLAQLGQALGVTAPVVGRYVDLLVDLLLVRRLQPWSGNLRKRLVRTPKIYVRDSGLVHSLLDIGSIDQLLGHPIAGLSWEGFAIEAMVDAAGPDMIPMFYRTHDGAEIDLLLERAGEVAFAIELKRSTAPKMPPGLTIAADDIGAQRRILIHSGTDSYIAGNGVEVMPLAKAIEIVST